MNNPVKFLRYPGIVAAIAFVAFGVSLFRPHYFGLAENPDIKIMTSDVLISGGSFKDQRSCIQSTDVNSGNTKSKHLTAQLKEMIC